MKYVWLFVFGVVALSVLQVMCSSDPTPSATTKVVDVPVEDDRQAAQATAAARRATEKDQPQRKQPAPTREAVDPFCGPKPVQSEWDGMLGEVNSYMRANLNDPSSYEGLGCSDPVLTKKSCWVSTCRFRAANALGAKVVQMRRFSIGRNPAGGLSQVMAVLDGE